MTESDWPSYLQAAMDAALCNSPADLARKTGVGEAVISRWLRGVSQPSIPQLRRLVPVLKVPILALAVAAGHFTAKEAQLRELPAPPSGPEGDPVELEIKAAGYKPDVETALLKMRQDNQQQVRDAIAALEAAGVLKGSKTTRR